MFEMFSLPLLRPRELKQKHWSALVRFAKTSKRFSVTFRSSRGWASGC